MESSKDIIENRKDVYNSRYIDDVNLPNDLDEFKTKLNNTLEKLKEEKAKGITMQIKIDKDGFFSYAHQKGFKFHHAEGDYAVLTTWLPDTPNKLPPYASHYVGVGGLVIDWETEKVLLIKEKTGHDTKGWKIPGGLVDAGEYLSEASVREVLEETGIKTNFVGLLGLREKKNYKFGRNDIYFVCLLEKINDDDIDQCPEEIAQCEWLPIADFVNFEHRVGTQEAIAGLAKKLVDLKNQGVDPKSLAWKFKDVEVNLETLKAKNIIYLAE